jgi:NDMA-dependent alcohol dehydrogenase
MKAAVLYETGSPLVVEEVSVEDPRDGEVLVRIAYAGMCHSDKSIARGGQPAALPAVLGHEGAGVVEAVGPGVTSVAVGDHVVLLWRAGCRHCYYCDRGAPAICEMGITARANGRMPDGTTRYAVDGRPVNHFNAVSTFAQYSVCPEVSVVRIPPEIPLDRAAVVGCAVLTGIGAVFNAGQVRPGARTAVVGCGGVGLNVVQGCAIAGAEVVVAIDPSADKREMALTFGATHAIDPTAVDPVAAVLDITGGIGADEVFEAVGQVATLEQASAMTRRGGTTVMIGMPAADARLPVNPLAQIVADKTLRGSIYGSSDFAVDVPRILGLYQAGRLRLDELVTGTYPLSQVNEAMDALGRSDVARSVIDPFATAA